MNKFNFIIIINLIFSNSYYLFLISGSKLTILIFIFINIISIFAYFILSYIYTIKIIKIIIFKSNLLIKFDYINLLKKKIN